MILNLSHTLCVASPLFEGSLSWRFILFTAFPRDVSVPLMTDSKDCGCVVPCHCAAFILPCALGNKRIPKPARRLPSRFGRSSRNTHRKAVALSSFLSFSLSCSDLSILVPLQPPSMLLLSLTLIFSCTARQQICCILHGSADARRSANRQSDVARRQL